MNIKYFVFLVFWDSTSKLQNVKRPSGGKCTDLNKLLADVTMATKKLEETLVELYDFCSPQR